jgi:hypothetical protein
MEIGWVYGSQTSWKSWIANCIRFKDLGQFFLAGHAILPVHQMNDLYSSPTKNANFTADILADNLISESGVVLLWMGPHILKMT